MSALCAMAVNLVQEVQAAMPIPSDVLNSSFLDRISNSDTKVITELQLALAERADKFHPRDIPSLHDVMEAHTGRAPVGAGTQMIIEKTQIEKSTFDLHMKQLEFDFQSWKVFDNKMANFFSARSHIQRQWKLDALTENKAAVKQYIDSHCKFLSFEMPHDLEAGLLKFYNSIEKKLQLPSKSVVLCSSHHADKPTL